MKKLLSIIAALVTASVAFGQAAVTRGGAGGLTVQQASLIFTTPLFVTSASPSANDGASLGTTSLGWSDLHGATGFTLNIANGNWLATHTSGILTVGVGDLRITSAGTNAASVVTVNGTQTLANKTLTTPDIGAATGTSVVLSGAATAASFTAAGSDAGRLNLPEGPATALIANTFSIEAPTDVAAGGLKYIVPSAAATGIMRAANSSGNMTISHSELSGDITTSGSNAATLATVNGNVGTFGSATAASVVTVNAKGLVTAGSNATITPSAASITAGTLTANITLGENFGFIYDPALSADGKYSGTVRAGTAGAALAFGDLVYLAAADSRWELTDADSDTTSGNVLIGICVLAAAADGDPTTILLQGFVRADTAFPTLTIGAPAYISPTAGDIQVAAPSTTGQIVRRVGFAWTADELYFNPSMDSGTAP